MRPETVRRYAALSKIDLSMAEEESLSDEMSSVLEYFKVLSELEITDVEATLSLAVEKTTDLREDEPVKCDPDDILALSSSRKGRFVKSPSII